MMAAFRVSMMKVANNGQDVDSLTDCSDVIPVPKVWAKPATLPLGKSHADLEQYVSRNYVTLLDGNV
jgi:hypothetical protein